MAQNGTRAPGPRCIALVGPFQSGKTTLLEAILARTGAIQRQGTVEAGTTVGDASKEARHHKMSVELSVATTSSWATATPSSIVPARSNSSTTCARRCRRSMRRSWSARLDEKKIPQLQLILRELEELKIPRFLFLNKIDKADKRVRDTLTLLQPASRVPLLLRQIPIWTRRHHHRLRRSRARTRLCLQGARAVRGDRRSKATTLDREKKARFTMLETLADHDDELMEQLLEDIPPPRDKVFDDLAKELRDGLVCPVLIGVGDAHQRRAAADEGAAPRGARRRRRPPSGSASRPATMPSPMCSRRCTPRMAARCRSRACSPARSATARPSITPEREAGRVAGVFKLIGQTTEKRGPAAAGETVALGKLDHANTGDTLTAGKQAHPPLVDGRAAIRRCWRSRSPPRSARTTSSSARRCTSCSTKTPRSSSCTIPKRTRSWSGGRARCICGSRPSGSPIASASPSSAAKPTRRLSRDHQEGRRAARPAQEAVRRPRPVRRRGARHQAAAARRRLHVRGGDQGRRGAAQLHSVGRGGRRRRAQARTARLPGGRRRGEADRRLLSHGRFLRHGVPHRRPHRHRTKACRNASRCCSSRSTRSRSSARRRRPRR